MPRGAPSRCCCRRPPGSGKTSVLVERFVRAVREDGIAPGADPRDHVHRARRRRAARARPRAPAGTRRARGGARHRGRLRRHLPRLLRAAAARPSAARRARPGLRDPRRGPVRAAAAASLQSGAAGVSCEGERREAVDLLAAYGVDRVRAMIERRPRASCAAGASCCRDCRCRRRCRSERRVGGESDGAEEADALRPRARALLARPAARRASAAPTSSSSARAARSTSTTWSCSHGALLERARERAGGRGRSASSC